MTAICAVVPSFNSELHIEQTVASLLNQTKPLHKIVIVDDGSQDGTLEVINRMMRENKNIELIQLKQNSGPSYARNIGVEHADSDWILFMDSDDIAHPLLIEELQAHLERLNRTGDQPEYFLAHPNYRHIDEHGKVIDELNYGRPYRKEEALGFLLLRNTIATSGILVNRELFRKVGGFNTEYRYAEDWDLWLRMSEHSGIAHINKHLVDIRRHSHNLSASMSTMHEYEKKVLLSYSLKKIKEAIFRRTKLSPTQNMCDYVSILFRLDKWEEGYTIIQELKDDDRNDEQVLFLEGIYFLKTESAIEAEKRFAEILNVNQCDGASLNNLGAVKLIRGKVEEGRNLLLRALELYPNYLDASYNLQANPPYTWKSLKFTWRKLRSKLISYNRQ
ncbi:glycosyl transferase group 2 [Geobacillus sp. GHH01]|uniref:glycosyltransferase n=1 Tax=Geobacillus sp. GHH01 TaxID=1233873 RepID=UPI0002AF29F4|nr:glycosyltransferase [Geobacillus sp. GHH01]AGE23692.1 glycosyl transferase group 2 [Geobacillus sp. GHH01]